MILYANKKQIASHVAGLHGQNHRHCASVCLWGFSNVKHRPHSGGVGQSARRKYLAIGKKYRLAPKKVKA